jgi:hypothetical protein
MTNVILTPNISKPDDLYEMLVNMTQGRSESESLKAQARLILIMANQIGDIKLIEEMIKMAESS